MDRHATADAFVHAGLDERRIRPAPPARTHDDASSLLEAANGLRQRIEWRLEQLVPAGPDGSAALVAAMRHALLGPGKRLRPMLVVLAGRELGTEEAALIDAGCALEMVHAASLVLDDLPAMDDAAMRRGRPTTHVAHGEATAILAAIGLLGRAFEQVSALPGVRPDRRSAMAALLARTIGCEGLAAGQLDDLTGLGGRHGAVALAQCSALKTGALFDAAVEMAGTIAGAEQRQLLPLRRFATHFAQAFQILDDLQDAGLEDEARSTYVSMLGRAEATMLLRRHVEGALSQLKPASPLALLVRASFREPLVSPDAGAA